MISSCPAMQQPWAGATWLDLCDATDVERDAVAAATGLRVPTRAAIEEIETTSRVFTENGALYLSTPVLAPKDTPLPLSAIGFVLTEKVLVSVRFAPHAVIDAVLASCAKEPAPSSSSVFLRLLEALVDSGADMLEHASTELDAISHRAFRADERQPRRKNQTAGSLRRTLRKLGHVGDMVSHIRDTLLGIGRISAFVSETSSGVLGVELPRLHAVRTDIASLSDYQSQLSSKVQFLLDATLGFISIEQNDVVKTLTIVSVVGVPPVLVAGIYGMNFHVMPELSWAYGYPFALLLIVVTALLPLVWFKWRGWI
jgi:magnesium transporter